MKSQNGQVILILILIMTVALSIGLSIVQKSLIDISTSSKVEQSSRAFSAAEAGVEEALRSSSDASCTNCQSFTNSSSIKEISDSKFPVVQAAGNQQDGLEYPPLGKEDVAQFWLADLNNNDSFGRPAEFYMPSTKTSDRGIEIYWGSPTAEKAAIAVKIVYYDGTAYKPASYYFDSDAARYTSNGFINASAKCSDSLATINTTLGNNRSFYCKIVIDSLSSPPFPSSGLMLVRTRLLYNSTSQPIAIRGYKTCGAGCSLPPQARSIIATGISGETQRKVNVFLLDKVVPPYFDYAIFSAGEIKK